MFSTIIIADDLTGANDSGVLLREMGMETVTALCDEVDQNWLDQYSHNKVVTIPTDSRADEKEVAWKKVYNMTSIFKEYKDSVFNKRIDSTLRGNVGAEIDGMLDAFEEERIAFVVPAFPASKRVCVGGIQLVNGTLLQNTDVAKDPLAPVLESRVKDIILKQSSRKVEEVFIDIIEQDEKVLKKVIDEKIASGAKIIVFDALTDEHIEKIAKVVVGMPYPFVTIGPGPFVKEVSKCKWVLKENDIKEKILLMIGSVTTLTKQQIKYVTLKESMFYYYVDALKLLYDTESSTYIEKVVNEVLEQGKDNELLCLTTTNIFNDYRVDLKEESKKLDIDIEEASKRINKALAKITKCIIQKESLVKGLYTCGGDTTVAITKAFDGKALQIEGEILPLAVYGSLMNDHGNIKIATKGGLIGDEDGLHQCITYLRKKIAEKG